MRIRFWSLWSCGVNSRIWLYNTIHILNNGVMTSFPLSACIEPDPFDKQQSHQMNLIRANGPLARDQWVVEKIRYSLLSYFFIRPFFENWLKKWLFFLFNLQSDNYFGIFFSKIILVLKCTKCYTSRSNINYIPINLQRKMPRLLKHLVSRRESDYSPISYPPNSPFLILLSHKILKVYQKATYIFHLTLFK